MPDEYDVEAEKILAARTQAMAAGGSFFSLPTEYRSALGTITPLSYSEEAVFSAEQVTGQLQPQSQVSESSVGALLGLIPWGKVATVAAGAGLGWLASLFGDDEETALVPGQPVELGGPGLAEPPSKYIVWQKRYSWGNMYRLNVNGRTTMAAWSRKKGWHFWKPMKMVVIGKKLPSHRQIVRLRSYLKKHTDDAKTILRITQPGALTTYATRQTQYTKKRR